MDKKKGLGLLIEPKTSSNEICMSTIVKSTADLPPKASLKEYCSPVVNQGDRGFCWAFTAAEFKAIQEKMEKGRTYQMSPLYCAKIGKSIDKLNEDGATSATLFKVITETGAIEEQYYPYSLVNEMSGLVFPSIEDGALPHYKCDVPVKLRTNYDIDKALSMGQPVALGIICVDTIWGVTADDPFIPMPSNGFVIGGHEIIVVGYDNTLEHVDKSDGKLHKGYYLIKNTWGEEWGDKGYAWLPKDYLTYSVEMWGDIKLTFFIDAYTALDLNNEEVKENVITMYIGDKTVVINGKEVEWDVAPVIEKDRTLVPLRGISEVLGYKVDWNDAQKRITMTKDGVQIIMFIGSNIVMVNGVTRTWDVAPKIDETSSRTLVPLRPIAELLGYFVIWRDGVKEITLIKQG